LAELWDLPNTLGIFYSKVVASVLVEGWRRWVAAEDDFICSQVNIYIFPLIKEKKTRRQYPPIIPCVCRTGTYWYQMQHHIIKIKFTKQTVGIV
jgi:hypothetical protein